MLATVTDDVSDGATLAVRGRPKGSFLTTKTGEDQHARGVETQIVTAIEAELGDEGRADEEEETDGLLPAAAIAPK